MPMGPRGRAPGDALNRAAPFSLHLHLGTARAYFLMFFGPIPKVYDRCVRTTQTARFCPESADIHPYAACVSSKTGESGAR
jgi:hypothetical protein